MAISIVGMCTIAMASDLTSSSFIIRDPVLGTGGQYGSSSSFKLFSTGNTLLSGVGSSATYIGHYGFQYYPVVTSPVLTATANVTSIDLDWTASVGEQGWNVSGYNTGVSNVPGGPYAYTSVGNVLTYTYTGLSPGQYCYVVQTLDAFSNVITTSNEDCKTITPGVTFAVSSGTIEFGVLTPVSTRYATTSGGSGTNAVAHTITASSNGVSGYAITYKGDVPTNGANSVSAATISADADGTPGTPQFAMSASTSGTATIPSAYQQSSLNWSFVPNTTTVFASTSGPTNTETISTRYLGNISNGVASGQYSTNITYIMTGNF